MHVLPAWQETELEVESSVEEEKVTDDTEGSGVRFGQQMAVRQQSDGDNYNTSGQQQPVTQLQQQDTSVTRQSAAKSAKSGEEDLPNLTNAFFPHFLSLSYRKFNFRGRS